MSIKVTGLKVVWGIPETIKPISGSPDGRCRLRFRTKDVGRAFYKTTSGIRHFVLLDNGEVWGLLEQGRNFRTRNTT